MMTGHAAERPPAPPVQDALRAALGAITAEPLQPALVQGAAAIDIVLRADGADRPDGNFSPRDRL